MKSALLVITVLLVAELGIPAEAEDGAAADSCDWEGVARACEEFLLADAAACCGALAAADRRRCFFSEAESDSRESRSQLIGAWISLGRGLCELEIVLPTGGRCGEEARGVGSRLSLAAHELSGLRRAWKVGQEQDSSRTRSGKEEEEGQDRDSASEEDTASGRNPGIMVAGMSGGLLAFCFPCLKKRRRTGREVVTKDFSINSISSNDASRALGRSYNSSFASSPFSSTGTHLPVHSTGDALTFTMAELMKVTGNFSPSHKIGQGGFGTVYKGRLRDGTVVAVKRAKKDAFEARLSVEFQNELNMLSQVDHLNLVKLIGYLEQDHERIIVVEYVPNGNLREHLDGAFGSVLDMATRLDISIDIAHALTYLHLYADRPIIHRDVKASNILLTDTCRAKVADFGFSRQGPTDQGATHVSTQVKGTAGYLDPEYLTTYQLNQKSDVYSFGILLVEIFTGRRPIELKRPSDERVTVRWAFKKFVEGKVIDVLDPKLERTPTVNMVMERLAELAFACSAPTKNDRPSMKKAQEALWQIRKDYQGQTTGSASPAHPSQMPNVSKVSHLVHTTFTIPEAPERGLSLKEGNRASPTDQSRASPSERGQMSPEQSRPGAVMLSPTRASPGRSGLPRPASPLPANGR